MQHQDRLDLGVVVRVVAGEELDSAPVGHPEARRRVGDPAPDDQRQHDREDQVAEPAPDRDLVARVLEEAAAADHVGLAVRAQRSEHVLEVLGLVLTVAVDLGGDVVAVSERVLEAGLHRPPDPEVEGVADDRRVCGLGLGRGVVGRAVVDDQDVEARRGALDVAHDLGDHSALVIGGNDRQLAQLIGGCGAHER